MTMLTCLRQEIKNKNYSIRVKRAPNSFAFWSYGDTLYLAERIAFEHGAIYTIEYVWEKMNNE